MSSSPHPLTAVFPGDRYGIAQPRDEVTADTIITLGLALAKDPAWEPGFTEVWDMRFTPSIDLVPSDAQTLLNLERKTREMLAGSATIIVTYRPLILFSIQFYARLVKPLGRKVTGLDKAEEAARLLGIPELPDLSAGAPV